MLIYLSGFMGSGKTTLAKKWSKSWDGEYFDFDQQMTKQLGIDSSQLGDWIEHHSWKQFRSLESELLKKTLTSCRGLYSLGGGTLISEENQILIGDCLHAKVLWLNTPVEECWQRVKDETHRPLVKLGKKAFFSLYAERLSSYRRNSLEITADLTLKSAISSFLT